MNVTTKSQRLIFIRVSNMPCQQELDTIVNLARFVGLYTTVDKVLYFLNVKLQTLHNGQPRLVLLLRLIINIQLQTETFFKVCFSILLFFKDQEDIDSCNLPF